jgi:hypothetical protein
MFYSFSLLPYLFQHMFHHLLYHTNRDQIMNLLRLGLLYLVCAAMQSMAETTEGVLNVELGSAGKFAILTKTGVTTTGTTKVTGNMGTSPIAQAALTGFALTLDASNTYATSPLVTGKVYAADHAAPTPADMTKAISDMEAAYTEAAGRISRGPTTDGCGAGDISGKTLTMGIYKWSTDVKFTTELYFDGSATDVWIMQIAGKFTAGPGAEIILINGAKAENIFWAVADAVAFDDGSHVEGIFLAQTMIAFNAGSSLTGAALAQTAVTMIATTIVAAMPGAQTDL